LPDYEPTARHGAHATSRIGDNRARGIARRTPDNRLISREVLRLARLSLQHPRLVAGAPAIPASTIDRSNQLEHSAILTRPVRGSVITGSGATPARSFWQDALAALPPAIQWRYAAHFEAAERCERNLEFMIDLWGRAKRALARSFAKVLRRSAAMLELTARRIAPTR
jgi:hypothetical protein